MLDNGISESVIDNFVTNETTHSKNYYIFSMTKLSVHTPNNTYNDCAVDNVYSRAASYTTMARIYMAELEGSNYWRAASNI